MDTCQYASILSARSFYIYHLLAMSWRVQQFLVKAELKL